MEKLPAITTFFLVINLSSCSLRDGMQRASELVPVPSNNGSKSEVEDFSASPDEQIRSLSEEMERRNIEANEHPSIEPDPVEFDLDNPRLIK